MSTSTTVTMVMVAFTVAMEMGVTNTGNRTPVVERVRVRRTNRQDTQAHHIQDTPVQDTLCMGVRVTVEIAVDSMKISEIVI